MTKVVAKLVGNKFVTVSREVIEPHVEFNPDLLVELMWKNIKAAIKAGTFEFNPPKDLPQAADELQNKRYHSRRYKRLAHNVYVACSAL